MLTFAISVSALVHLFDLVYKHNTVLAPAPKLSVPLDRQEMFNYLKR